MLPEKTTTIDDLKQILPRDKQVISYEDWKLVDKVEKERGQEKGKTREKILSKDEMLRIINKA